MSLIHRTDDGLRMWTDTTLMTTRARQRQKIMTKRAKLKKQAWRGKVLRCGCWNIRSWRGREQEILLELKEKKIDIYAISETKLQGKGNLSLPGYTLKYSGTNKGERVLASVEILVSNNLKYNIEDTCYTN